MPPPKPKDIDKWDVDPGTGRTAGWVGLAITSGLGAICSIGVLILAAQHLRHAQAAHANEVFILFILLGVFALAASMLFESFHNLAYDRYAGESTGCFVHTMIYEAGDGFLLAVLTAYSLHTWMSLTRGYSLWTPRMTCFVCGSLVAVSIATANVVHAAAPADFVSHGLTCTHDKNNITMAIFLPGVITTITCMIVSYMKVYQTARHSPEDAYLATVKKKMTFIILSFLFAHAPLAVSVSYDLATGDYSDLLGWIIEMSLSCYAILAPAAYTLINPRLHNQLPAGIVDRWICIKRQRYSSDSDVVRLSTLPIRAQIRPWSAMPVRDCLLNKRPTQRSPQVRPLPLHTRKRGSMHTKFGGKNGRRHHRKVPAPGHQAQLEFLPTEGDTTSQMVAQTHFDLHHRHNQALPGALSSNTTADDVIKGLQFLSRGGNNRLMVQGVKQEVITREGGHGKEHHVRNVTSYRLDGTLATHEIRSYTTKRDIDDDERSSSSKASSRDSKSEAQAHSGSESSKEIEPVVHGTQMSPTGSTFPAIARITGQQVLDQSTPRTPSTSFLPPLKISGRRLSKDSLSSSSIPSTHAHRPPQPGRYFPSKLSQTVFDPPPTPTKTTATKVRRTTTVNTTVHVEEQVEIV